MTLNITIVAPWGVWQSCDFRLTEWPTGKLIDDYSIKSLSVHCVDGTALVTYTGLGKVRNVHVSDWMRKSIHGETLTLDQTLIRLRERANRALAKFCYDGKIPHTFSIGAFLAGRPWAAVITNVEPTEPLTAPPLREFYTDAKQGDDEQILMAWGVRQAITDEDWNVLKKIYKKRPSRPRDYMMLLAAINERASKHPIFRKFISGPCLTSYLPPNGSIQQYSSWKGATPPSSWKAAPMLFHGLDLTEMMQDVMDRHRKLKETSSESEQQDND